LGENSLWVTWDKERTQELEKSNGRHRTKPGCAKKIVSLNGKKSGKKDNQTISGANFEKKVTLTGDELNSVLPKGEKEEKFPNSK